MSRINTNIASMNAITKLVSNNADLTTRLQRLSSGLRINTGKDDPAGLIASENLRSEMKGLESGIKNSTRASSVIATAEGALNEISALLVDIKGLLVETANKGALSTEEIDANQLQVDSAINSVDRIANATEFEGIKLLNGNLDYSYTGGTLMDSIKINAAKLIDGAAMSVNVDVTTAATQGSITAATTALTGAVTMQLSSNRGTTELSFANATTEAAMATAINAVSEVTGVTASTTSGDLVLTSVDYGADAYVTMDITSGTALTDGTAAGVDIVANVNGTSATGKGAVLKVRTSMLDAEFDMTGGGADDSLSITSGGADFAIGSRVDAIGMEAIGIPNIASGQLGLKDTYYLSSIKSGATNALSRDRKSVV